MLIFRVDFSVRACGPRTKVGSGEVRGSLFRLLTLPGTEEAVRRDYDPFSSEGVTPLAGHSLRK